MRNQSERPSRCDGGFSLMEFIVALALLALLMALLPSTVRMAKRAAAFATQLSGSSTTATSMVAVERLLREAMPQIERDETGALKIAFDGQNASLSFVSPANDGPYGACLCRFRIASVVSENGARPDIILMSEPWTASDPSRGATGATSQKRMLTLASGHVSFRYFGVAPGETAAQWHAVWMRKDRLPDLVEIDLPASVPSGRRPAPVVVELMLRRQR